MAEAKHAFVDDNPYLVYSPKAEMTYDGNGGGGSVGIPTIEEDFNTGELNITADELISLMKQSIVVAYADLYEGAARLYLVSMGFAPLQGGGYKFAFIVTSGENVQVVFFEASDGDSKPTESQASDGDSEPTE